MYAVVCSDCEADEAGDLSELAIEDYGTGCVYC